MIAGRRWSAGALSCLALAWGLGCKPDDGRTTLTVLAASSLTDVFADLEQDFERTHPDIDVVVSTAGSQVLRLQIEHGAPADLFASAHARHLQALAELDAIAEQSVFAHNQLAIAVPYDNPAGVAEVADLARVDRLVLGAPEVPIGQYTEAFLELASQHLGPDFPDRVRARVVSREPNVRLVRARVALGEADAAVVYRTDLVGAFARQLDAAGARPQKGPGDLCAIAIPPALSPPVAYHIALLSGAEQPAEAREFLEFLASAAGLSVLRAHGFLAP